MRRREGAVLAAVALWTALTGCSSQDGAGGNRPSPTLIAPAQTPTAVQIEPSTSDDTGSTPGPSSATSLTSPSERTEEPFEPREITVAMSGDVLLHEGLWATAEIDAARTGRGQMDFRPLLADMKPVLSDADLSICHMETPLAPRGGPYLGYPLFSAPPAVVPALKWVGYDVCTTASNHSIDQGFDGLTRTLDDFARAEIATAGTASTRKESRQPLLLDVNGVEVALISATFGTNGIPLPSDQPWSVPLIDTDEIARMAATATRQGAEVVLVALHWGLEYTHAPVQDQLDVAHALSRSPDIDLIYGHHAHVVQPYDKVRGTWVVYGLGNAVAQQDTQVEGVYDGNTARVTFVERKDGSFTVAGLEYIPTLITPFDDVHPMRWLNVPQDLGDPRFASLQPALRVTRQRVTEVVYSLGARRLGVTEGE